MKMEFLKWLTFTSNHTLPALLLAVGEKLSNKDPSYVSHMHNKYLSLRSRLSELLGQNGVLLYPTHPNPAPYHNQPVFQAFNFAYTAIFNTLGFPSTQCPLGLGSTGVPLGLQVIGNLHCDHITLAVAVELEKAFGGWIPPCPTP